MSRRIARECTFKLIFESLFHESPLQEGVRSLIEETESLSTEDVEYIQNTYRGVLEHKDELSSEINRLAKGFSGDRIYKIDTAVMLLAIYELHYHPEIPESVVISEAVELVKRYSTQKSNSFVNGILANVYKSLKEKENEDH